MSVRRFYKALVINFMLDLWLLIDKDLNITGEIV